MNKPDNTELYDTFIPDKPTESELKQLYSKPLEIPLETIDNAVGEWKQLQQRLSPVQFDNIKLRVQLAKEDRLLNPQRFYIEDVTWLLNLLGVTIDED